MRAHSQGGKEITSTGKTVVNTKMGVTANITEIRDFWVLPTTLPVMSITTLHLPLHYWKKYKWEGKRGRKAVAWDDAGRLAFENIKIALK